MNPQLLMVDGRTVLRLERRLAHPPEKVWRAVTEQAEMAHWFPGKMYGERVLGGRLRYEYDAGGDGLPNEGMITDYDPPRLFGFTWGDNALRLEVRPDGDGSVLVLSHTFDDRPYAASYAAGWMHCVDDLARHLAGEPAQEMTDYPAAHERYIELFDLSAGSASPAGGGWQVRFERIFPYPPEAVFDALAETAAQPPTTAERPTSQEYGGGARYELSPGDGGTRVIRTETAPAAEPALAAGREHLTMAAERLAKSVLP